MRRAVFLDRDGVINHKAPTEVEYVTRWEQMYILPGVEEAVARLNRAGFDVYIVTNQRGVAKGLITTFELESLHQRLCTRLAQHGARIDGVYYCPHEIEPPCDCRKPKPGMLLLAALEHDVDLRSSWMIGDSTKDVDAGKKAGCRTAFLTSDHMWPENGADLVASSLLVAVKNILELTTNSNGNRLQTTDKL